MVALTVTHRVDRNVLAVLNSALVAIEDLRTVCRLQDSAA